MKLISLNRLGNIVPILSYTLINDELCLVVSSRDISSSLNCLKLHIGYQYKLLSCISGVDFLNTKYRFSVVYDLLSLTYNTRIRVKVFINEITPIRSVVDIYRNAD